MNRSERPTCGALLVVGLCAALAPGAGTPAQDGLSPAAARKELAEMYGVWGRARVAVERETLEALLAPDFRLLVDGKQSTGAEFLEMVTQVGGARLTRFDAEILTLQHTGKNWTAVITEKLEWEAPGADGKPRKLCNLWVTRDTCSKEDGEWLFHSSEALGVESWGPGVAPPLPGW